MYKLLKKLAVLNKCQTGNGLSFDAACMLYLNALCLIFWHTIVATHQIQLQCVAKIP